MGENEKCFSEEELLILCDGIMALEEKAEKALSLIKSKEVHKIMSEELWKYSELRAKLCVMMGGSLWRKE